MDLAKNRGLLAGGAVIALIALGGLGFWAYSNSQTPQVDESPPVIAPRTAGKPTVPKPGNPQPFQTGGAPKKPVTSWDAEPTPGGGGGVALGQESTPGPPGGGGAAGPKPAPIKEGKLADNARRDPFVTFLRTVSVNPPAYALVVPQRLASYTVTIPPTINGVDQIGPLPAVSRRVAGIVTSNGVSAILESGDAGGGADTRVVQPGSKVPSFIAGIEDLTVESITSNGLTLRENAPNSRSVQVKLSPLPAGVVESLLGSGNTGQGGGRPGFGGGAGGFPGAAGGGRGGGKGGDL